MSTGNDTLVNFGLSGVACMCAAMVTNPIDVLKTRLQLQGELKKGRASIYAKDLECTKAPLFVLANRTVLPVRQRGCSAHPHTCTHTLCAELHTWLGAQIAAAFVASFE